MLYAAEQRRACFAETLAGFRRDLKLQVVLDSLPSGDAGDDTPESGIIPDDWHLKRAIASFRVVPGQHWLDLRAADVRERLRHTPELVRLFVAHGLTDFDLGDLLARDRSVTQGIAAWAWDNGYQGVLYTSRLDAAFDCWALFDGARFEVEQIRTIPGDDPDLVAVATFFGLRRPV